MSSSDRAAEAVGRRLMEKLASSGVIENTFDSTPEDVRDALDEALSETGAEVRFADGDR